MIEPLESRIAPATLNGQVLTYTDIDGDHVTVTISKGALNAGMFSFVGIGNKQSLELIDLSSLSNLAGANISVSVVQAGGGDGLVAIGRINAGTNNLGAVKIKGDLGDIDCGSGAAGAVALKSLSVNTLGRYGLGTQSGSGNLNCDIEGNLGSLVVHGDVTNSFVFASGIGGSIGSVSIGGSLLGGAGSGSGRIESAGNMGPVKIGGDVQGGTGQTSGIINSQGKLASVTIGGSLAGDSQNSGQIFSGGDMGPVKIGRDLTGGSGAYSGYIDTFGNIASVSVGGSVIGDTALDTGKIAANGDIGPVKIGRNLQAGPISTGGLGFFVGGDEAGKIDAGEGGTTGKIASVTIGGSLMGGLGNDNTFTDSHSVIHAGQIFALGDLGPVKIGGDVQGGSGANSAAIVSQGNMVSISIAGSLVGGGGAGSTSIFAALDLPSVKIGRDIKGDASSDGPTISSTGLIGSVQVGGSMTGGTIGSASSLGLVKIGGDLRGISASSSAFITAGSTIGKVSIGGSFAGGPADDSGLIAADSSIGSVTIGHDLTGGSIGGSTGDLTDSGDIRSQHIGSVFIGGSVLAGTDSSTGGALFYNATIRGGDIGSITVKGNVVGTVGSGGDITPVFFVGHGTPVPTATSDLAIKSLTIGGSTQRMTVLAGYDENLTPQDGNAQLGTVKIKGDFVASNLVAGAINYGANNTNDNGGGDDNVNFGDGNDHIIGGPFVSKIFSVNIGGFVAGTPDSVSDTDHFGIVAQTIVSLKIDGITVPTPPGPGAIDLSPFTSSDVTAVTFS